jgi:putative FmdB family regulatory protein
MPFYEYRCDACGHELEAMQKMSDAPLVACPACGKPELKRLISAAGFRLKGGGWYETDFKAGKKKNVHEGAAGEIKDTSAKSEATDKKGPKDKKGAAPSGGGKAPAASATD